MWEGLDFLVRRYEGWVLAALDLDVECALYKWAFYHNGEYKDQIKKLRDKYPYPRKRDPVVEKPHPKGVVNMAKV